MGQQVINYHTSKIEEYTKDIADNTYHATLCDPPYALGFMNKAWDSEIPQTAVWAELLRVSRPGAFLMAWGGARTQHRLLCNIEDAGWEIKTSLIWLYGNGFPKAQGIDRAIEAKEWIGYKTPQLKPAHEVIVLAQKPVDKTYVNNCLTWGCGALNIGDCRVGDEVLRESSNFRFFDNSIGEYHADQRMEKKETTGRYPSDVLLQQCPVCELNTGSVARYFKQFKYCKKASKKERNAGCDTLEVKDTDSRTEKGFKVGGMLPAPQRNNHPCVKPIDVNEWLAKLILPPANGKILIPFSGSGSEAIGARMAGWEHIDLVEMSEEYMEIAQARIEYQMT